LNARLNIEAIHSTLFGELMLHWVLSYTDSTSISQCMSVEEERATPKSTSSHCSHVTSTITQAKAHSSALALERKMAVCFLVFQAIKEKPIKTQYAERDLKFEGLQPQVALE
jgi:hypothetical protein